LTTRTPLTQTADLFFRISRASDQLGISQREAAQITLSLSKALSASGLSTQEASASLLQLGQALQSGTFQGDELRSILEQLPPVATALAKELGVPVGALKELGSQGQISADVFVKAMRSARDSIDEAFGRTQPTIRQALETLTTRSKLAFDNFEQNTQTGRNLALAIEYIGFQIFKLVNNIDKVIGPLTTFVQIAASLAVFTIAGRILRGFTAAIEAIPLAFSRLGAAVSNSIDFIKNFGSVITAAGRNFTGFSQVILFILKPVTMLVEKLGALALAVGTFLGIDKLIEDIKNVGNTATDSGKEFEAFRQELEKQALALDDNAGASKNAAYLAEQLAKSMATARLEMSQQVAGVERSLKATGDRLGLENDLLEKVSLRYQLSKEDADLAKLAKDREQERDGVLAGLNDQLAKMNLQYSQMTVKDSQAGKELAGRIGLIREQIGLTKEIYNTEADRLLRLTRDNQNLNVLIEDRKRTQDNIIKSIEDQIKRTEQLGSITRENLGKLADVEFERTQLGRSPFEKQIAQIQENARKGALAAGRAFADSFGEADLTPEKAQELADGLAQIEGQFKKIADAQIANLNSSRTWEQGWKEAFGQYMDNATNAAAQAKQAFDNVTRGFEDAIVKFVQTGKLSFRDFANTVIAEMTRMSIRQFLGGAGGSTILGSLGSWFKGLFGFANGGVIPTNGPVIVGERGPEVIAGAAGRNVIPNHQLGGASYVTYNINAVDSMSFKQMLARDPSFLFSLTEQGRRTVPTTRR